MSHHILAPDNAGDETHRLMDQATHCRELATSLDEAQLVEQLVALARSYEAKAALLEAASHDRI